MRVALCAVVCVLALGAVYSHAEGQFRTVSLAEGIYAFVAPDTVEDVQGNVTLVVGRDAALLFDAGASTDHARALLTEVRRLTQVPVRTVVYSHWHYDHVFGAPVFLEAYPAAQILGHRETARIGGSWARYYPQRATDEAIKRERYVLPTATFDREVAIDLGGRVVQLLNFGRGNTPGDAVAWLPAERIALTGDLVVHPVPYGFNCFPATWIDVMRDLEELGASVYVPGHGAVQRDARYIAQVRSMLETVVTQVRAAVAANMSLEDTRKKVDLSAFHDSFRDTPDKDTMFQSYWLTPVVERAWREAKAEF